MYANYFGLKELSFSITPDPQYLFLSDQHREALAHLVYGAGENGGFVLLTGEVGTGKTTVCRAFLEQLPEHVDLALILHPALSATELLRAICDEFRIPLLEEDRTAKRLVDRLHRYLLEAHAQGRRPVLMIDESQDLSPRVLEQIRLLTNLETPKHKLLQIFLVGQPELREMLHNPGLRQLNQRITARYHLNPFSAQDTTAYVQHRLAVAGVDRPLFTRSALRQLHRESKGVPRLINIFCDRALLGACVTRGPMVTRRILDKAIAEVQDGHFWRKPSRVGRWAALAAGLLVVAIGAGWGYWEYAGRPDLPPHLASLMGLEPAPEPPSPDAVTVAAVAEDPAQIALAKAVADERIGDLLAGGELLAARDTALRLLLQKWSVELGQLSGREACARLSTFGLECELDRGGWSRVRDYNLPVLLHLQDKDGRDGWAALIGLGENQATLQLPGGRETLSLAALDGLWTGDYLLVWQPPPVGGTVIRPGSSGEAVRWLRHLLTQVPALEFKDDGSNKFDRNVEKAVRRFQTQAGLEVDGMAGPRTLIRLATAVDMPGLPKLTSKD
ncbi:MAG: AAA family ATPase [Chromatiaceae bacterium]